MNEYTDFAAVYDSFMEDVPRKDWAAFIKKRLDEKGINSGILLDMGCGTGVMTKIMAGLGYDMIGTDASADMLGIAMAESDESILYLLQEFSELELYGTVAGVISTCDCINYITDKDELISVFKKVNNYLEKDGLFIFDINSMNKYENVLGDNIFAESLEDCAYIWENQYENKDKLNFYGLTLFVEDPETGQYEKSYEEHVQRAYELSEIKECLITAGMEFLGAYVDYTDEEIDADNYDDHNESVMRITILAKEGYQEGKTYL